MHTDMSSSYTSTVSVLDFARVLYVFTPASFLCFTFSVIFVLIYFLVSVLVFRLFFSFSFVLVFVVFLVGVGWGQFPADSSSLCQALVFTLAYLNTPEITTI